MLTLRLIASRQILLASSRDAGLALVVFVGCLYTTCIELAVCAFRKDLLSCCLQQAYYCCELLHIWFEVKHECVRKLKID
jgi:hypothetical protein